jgi:uncharacterized lipoprotein YmbA
MQPNLSNRSRGFGILRRSFVLLLGASAAVAFSSCAFLQPRADPTRFYVLTVGQAAPAAVIEADVKRWRVGLRAVEVPAYLQTRFMVVRTGTNEIHFAEFDRWAEPLDRGISRVLKDSLGSARNVESVALDSHGEDMLDYEFRIRILACEGTRGEHGADSLRFAMTWELRSVGTNSEVMKHGAFAASPAVWDGNDYGRLALGLSDAIAGAGKALATDLPMSGRSADKARLEAVKP